MMDTKGGGVDLDSDDEGEVGSEEEVVQLIMETQGSVPDVINDQHQLNPDIRLVRNIWTKGIGYPQERVKNVKFMCGEYLHVCNARCNELLCDKSGMVETPICACCGVVETP
jgi:hypothetical protein